MSRKINVLMPEPITLMDDESSQNGRNRSDSTGLNQNFNFQRAQVSDCTVVNGEHGAKFAVWKVTLVLQPSDYNASYYPRIVAYKRYSDFYQFRQQIIRQCKEAHENAIEIPQLPPRVKWYETWRYQDINLNKVWLAKRRQGLEYFLNHILLNNEIVTIAKDLIISFIEKQPVANIS